MWDFATEMPCLVLGWLKGVDYLCAASKDEVWKKEFRCSMVRKGEEGLLKSFRELQRERTKIPRRELKEAMRVLTRMSKDEGGRKKWTAKVSRVARTVFLVLP